MQKICIQEQLIEFSFGKKFGNLFPPLPSVALNEFLREKDIVS